VRFARFEQRSFFEQEKPQCGYFSTRLCSAQLRAANTLATRVFQAVVDLPGNPSYDNAEDPFPLLR
jgi:hypothetical protein